VGVVFRLEAVNTLGRDVNNSIVLDDEFVSAQHAALTFRGKAWYVEDLGSTNGTYVNGEPIVEVWPLTYGDEIQIGQVRLRLDRGHR
jgi:pSer/pThr/pTyr-binding forkhead associated (FHA) protein